MLHSPSPAPAMVPLTSPSSLTTFSLPWHSHPLFLPGVFWIFIMCCLGDPAPHSWKHSGGRRTEVSCKTLPKRRNASPCCSGAEIFEKQSTLEGPRGDRGPARTAVASSGKHLVSPSLLRGTPPASISFWSGHCPNSTLPRSLHLSLYSEGTQVRAVYGVGGPGGVPSGQGPSSHGSWGCEWLHLSCMVSAFHSSSLEAQGR